MFIELFVLVLAVVVTNFLAKKKVEKQTEEDIQLAVKKVSAEYDLCDKMANEQIARLKAELKTARELILLHTQVPVPVVQNNIVSQPPVKHREVISNFDSMPTLDAEEIEIIDMDIALSKFM